ELGRQQAEEAAKSLAALPNIDCIYTSPVLRALNTASIVGQAIGMAPVKNDELKERGQGILEGKNIPDYSEWRFDPSNQLEPWEDLKTRMFSFMKGAKGNVIVAVSHADPIAAACDSVDGKGESENAQARPANCHFSIIDFSSKEVIAKNADAMHQSLINLINNIQNK
ncbi:MAG: histidine phosphatase family protein, partial [Candidatus Micrarchaeota archaeon]|nr:histidine phosphatase family protein [Candidatus Micrarchaeota archaeon]